MDSGLADKLTTGGIAGAGVGAPTLTSTFSVVVPPPPVHDRLNLVFDVRALIVFEPDVFIPPVQPPEAEQLLALVLIQLNVVEPPYNRLVGLAEIRTVGATVPPATVTLTVSLTFSLSPLQVIVNVLFAVSALMNCFPTTSLLPDQSPEAIQPLTL
jgi:hypothetical protein